MKSEVYSWRVSSETKMALEDEARRAGVTVSALLDRMAEEWIEARRRGAPADADEQTRLHADAGRCIGVIAGGKPQRSETARDSIRKRLARRHAR
jgi:hypothetical protein